MLNDGETITDTEARTKVWTREGPELKAIAVETGVTNGILTQILRGASAGTQVITEVTGEMPEMDESQQQQNSNPFMPKPRNRNNNNNSKKPASK